MRGFFEKLQLSAMSLNSEEGTFFGAMLFGIGCGMKKCLDNIEAYRNLLEEEIEDNPAATAYLDAQRDNLKRLGNIVAMAGKIMEASKSGERLHLVRLVQGVLDRYHANLPPERHASAQVDDSLYVRCNPFQIQQLLFDMLNEHHFFELGGKWNLSCQRVTLKKNELGALNLTEEKGNEFVVCRIDEAEGKDLPLAGNFLPLGDCLATWADLTEDDLQQGLEWLGLALMNGCDLMIRSDIHCHGMALLFPVVNEREKGSDILSHYSWSNPGDPKTILLVDDEDMIWDVITEMLQDLGYTVVLAGNGKEAVEVVNANPNQIDLVIMDMLMPEMGGKEAFYILKKIDPNIKVLVSSGYVSESEIQDVMDDGAAGFLRKPYRMADLAKKIHSILE